MRLLLDAKRVGGLIGKGGGLDRLFIKYYSDGDTGSDKVWDRWHIEGPGFSWYFRGSPHVHAWVNIADPS